MAIYSVETTTEQEKGLSYACAAYNALQLKRDPAWKAIDNAAFLLVVITNMLQNQTMAEANQGQLAREVTIMVDEQLIPGLQQLADQKGLGIADVVEEMVGARAVMANRNVSLPALPDPTLLERQLQSASRVLIGDPANVVRLRANRR